MEEAQAQKVTFAEAFRFWLKLGFISFGGPTGQIAIMHTELVEKKRWISEPRFLHALNYCMFLPGPEAQQLAIYIGWLLHRTIGGIVAGTLFVLPSMFLMWALSYLYVEYGNVSSISSVFYGLKGAVTAIIAFAVLRIGKKVLKNEIMWLIAAAAFVAIFFFHTPFPLIVLSAAVIGLVGGRVMAHKFLVIGTKSDAGEKELPLANLSPGGEDHTKPSWRRAVKIVAVCVTLWWLPILLTGFWLGRDHTIFREGVFFSKAAMVTFGGAYAVLPYVAQQAENDHWLEPGQMMDGLGLAETTPGPLIMVVQFVGFLAAWNQPGGLPTLTAATLGALITTWATFVPCFLWIFLGAPHIEQLRGNTKLNSALSAVTAAVVGVVLSLAVTFATHAMLPNGLSVDWFLVILSVAGFIAMGVWKLDMVPVILLSAMFGMYYRYILERI